MQARISSDPEAPHLTPSDLFTKKALDVDLALLCFCPSSPSLEKYKVENIEERLFLHIHPSHTFYALLNGVRFIVICEVYGGPVAVSVVEELAFYGVKSVIGLGFVGSLLSTLKQGDMVIVERALTEPGTTPFYSLEEYLSPDQFLLDYFLQTSPSPGRVTSWTTNAIYREYTEDIQEALSQGCQVVNMDTSHLYASCGKLGIKCVYLAAISDGLEKDTQDLSFLSQGADLLTNLCSLVYDNLDYLCLFLGCAQMMDEISICPSHNLEHLFKVFQHCKQALLLEELEGGKKRLCNYASILHDIDDGKFFSTRDYANARRLLSRLPEEQIEEVVRMISLVSSSVNGDSMPEDCIEKPYMLYPRHADRLEAIGAVGVYRCYRYCKTTNMPMFTPDTPKAKDEEDLWQNVATEERYKAYKGKSASMIDHYYDKLLRLGLFETKNTYLQRIKKDRIDIMVRVVMNFAQKGYVEE
ncbi:nucleoside phosphorylase [Cedratvirus kamchatka]|uniref:Nucleoside phosphorylase n=1 Tax=Cedratvirus kamchatka TaxID=2716914 RepID=A0A6G8MY54_9VIRU|nr:nucleoside phosphorylase [Cedratvirus kamchatka]